MGKPQGQLKELFWGYGIKEGYFPFDEICNWSEQEWSANCASDMQSLIVTVDSLMMTSMSVQDEKLHMWEVVKIVSRQCCVVLKELIILKRFS